MQNNGYLKSSRTADERYTPHYAVEPIIKYLPKNSIIWLPFDKEWSAFHQVLKHAGFLTICSHIDNGQDFFNYEPFNYDVIVSNPPYSLKSEVLERVYQLRKPFFLLLPLPALQRKGIRRYYEKGLQILSFDERIHYHNPQSMDKTINSTPFASVYFVGGGLLPKDLVIESLNKYDCPLTIKEMI